MSPSRRTFLRDLEAGPLLDLVLVMAVLSVLLIRFWLHVTDYPRVGGDTLHIAHMLWGGLLMLAALVMLLAFLDNRARRLAAARSPGGSRPTRPRTLSTLCGAPASSSPMIPSAASGIGRCRTSTPVATRAR